MFLLRFPFLSKTDETVRLWMMAGLAIGKRQSTNAHGIQLAFAAYPTWNKAEPLAVL